MQKNCEPPLMPCPDGRVTLDITRLKALRQGCGLSQEALSAQCLERRLCLSLASVKRAESGRPVLYRTARHLAGFYGVAVAALIVPQPAMPATSAAEVAEVADMAEDEPRRPGATPDAVRARAGDPLGDLVLGLLKLGPFPGGDAPEAAAYEALVRQRCRALGLPGPHADACLSLLTTGRPWPLVEHGRQPADARRALVPRFDAAVLPC